MIICFSDVQEDQMIFKDNSGVFIILMHVKGLAVSGYDYSFEMDDGNMPEAMPAAPVGGDKDADMGRPMAADRDEADRNMANSAPTLKPVTKIRSEFPETWLWSDAHTG